METTDRNRQQDKNRNSQTGDGLEFSREVGMLWPHNKTNGHDRHSDRDGKTADLGPTRGNWGRSSPTSPPLQPRTSASRTRPLTCSRRYVHVCA